MPFPLVKNYPTLLLHNRGAFFHLCSPSTKYSNLWSNKTSRQSGSRAQESFQAQVLSDEAESTAYWAHWLAEHPDKKAVFQEARTLVRQLSLQVDDQEVEDEFHRLQQQLLQTRVPSVRMIGQRLLPYAAAAFLIGFLTFWFWPDQAPIQLQEVSTAIGITQEVHPIRWKPGGVERQFELTLFGFSG